MLLQQRSMKKITFPGLWSNTCCSHPLSVKEELVEENNKGIISAAKRRMNFELSIKTKEEDYRIIEKILYRADSSEIFEEFERKI